MDAVKTYVTQAEKRESLDDMLASEKILFCCQSRLTATLWVRAERGRYNSQGCMPENMVGCCTTLDEALSICVTTPPTLLITTQHLEVGTGLQLIQKAKLAIKELRTLLFLQYSHRALFEEAIKTHSDGIVLESEISSGHVIAALRTVSKGGIYLEPLIAEEIHGTVSGKDPGLTNRELAVMQEVTYGLNDREIGQKLFISVDTVKYHLKQVYHKLNVHNRTRAAISLVLLGLVEPPRPLLP